jgi:UDP-N-acetylglucosamine--N-acetylmuramyl-(pentapeptide) pyrophosphoryl-undecaprenol N-acetylglucosamine transferase
LICAGGTGGGAYPALAVLQALRARQADVETLWVGTETGMEAELVKRQGVTFTGIPAAGLHGVGLAALPGNLLQILRGVVASRRILGEFRPDVLFFTGGYVAGPMALAGWRVPTLLFVPDIEPGLALKVLVPFADRIAISADASQKYFTQKTVVTGYPVRADLLDWTRESGRTALKLAQGEPVLLVSGGSKGARSINRALIEHLPALLEIAQVVHITGLGEWDSVVAATSELTLAQSGRYRRFAYLHEEMGAALAAADVAVMRAGASVLGELSMFGLPAILVPYPHAWRYQRVNAAYLEGRHAAIVVDDAVLRRDLFRIAEALLQNSSKREAMRSAMRSLAHPAAAQALAAQLLELGGHRP